MAPRTRASPKTKAKKTRKEGIKRKRKPSEDETSQDQSNSEKQDSDGEGDYGKFEKYNKDKPWKLKRLHHHLLPSFNITKFTDLNDVRNLPLVHISLPHSLYVNSRFSQTVEMCHRRTLALNSYMCRLKTLKTNYLTAKRKNKSVRKDEKNGIYRTALIDYAELRDLHPDKHFVQDYDFYYTGGNLSINKRSNQIAHAAGTDLSTIVLSVFNVHNNIPTLHKLTSADLNDDKNCEVFEVQSSLSNDDFWFIRQKHCLSVQEFRNSKLNVVQNFRSKDVPFISFTQDFVNTHHLAISDLIHRVRLCDIEKGVPIQTLKMMPRDQIKTSNNWNMIKSIDSHVYIYSMRKEVKIIDIRLPESEWKSNYCRLIEDQSCYSFCGLARSKFENLFYLSSSHKAYCIDRRYMGKDVESRNAVVATWTHQMSSFPLMVATCYSNNVEYIAFQSPLNSDLRICENMQFLDEPEQDTGKAKKAKTDLPPEYMYKSPCLPYMPQSLESVFQEARLNGQGIKQGTGISDRVKACITGLDITDDISCQYLITATSNGDVFARQICYPEDDIKPDTVTASEVINKFEENIFRSVRKNPISVTEVHNMAGISKVFRCPLLNSDNKKEEDPCLFKRKCGGRWQKSIQSLSKYKDALAADLFSIWDFEVDEEKDLNIIALNNTEVSDLKVSGWLENTPDMAHSTMLNMTSIPMDVFNASNLNSTLGDNSFNDYERTESKTQTELNQSANTKPKSAKKKTRYVKGF